MKVRESYCQLQQIEEIDVNQWKLTEVMEVGGLIWKLTDVWEARGSRRKSRGVYGSSAEALVAGSWWKLPLPTKSGKLHAPPEEFFVEASMKVNNQREHRGGPTDLQYYTYS